MVIVGSAHQVNRHFTALGTTFGWSTAPYEPMRCAFGGVHVGATTPYTKHLAQMFAGWGGAMDIRVTVSGSGLFAGKLVCGVLPPGVNPTLVNDPGVLPHALVDARITEPACFNVADVRAVDYHRTDGDEATATLGIWVLQPLINPFSNEAVSTAWISIETKPGSLTRVGLTPGGSTPQTSLPANRPEPETVTLMSIAPPHPANI